MKRRWEQERAAWIAGRATTPSGRRIGEVLARRARRQDREEAGVGETDAVTAVTPPWFRRGWKTVIGYIVGGMLLGAIGAEAVGLAWLVYGVWVWLASSRRFAPRFIVPVVLSVIGFVILRQTGTAGMWAEWLTREVPPYTTVVEIVLDRLPVTLALTPIILAVLVWRRGWRAVTGARKQRGPKQPARPKPPISRGRDLKTVQAPEPMLAWPEQHQRNAPKPTFTDEED